jgi:hypothetical protein
MKYLFVFLSRTWHFYSICFEQTFLTDNERITSRERTLTSEKEWNTFRRFFA